MYIMKLFWYTFRNQNGVHEGRGADTADHQIFEQQPLGVQAEGQDHDRQL